MPDTTSGIVNVAVPSRDHVHVQVEDGLASRLTAIDPDVVTVRSEIGLDGVACHVDRASQCDPLLDGRLEPAPNVSGRDKQDVSWGHRETIPEPDHKRISIEHPVRLRHAERAVLRDQRLTSSLGRRTICNCPGKSSATHSTQRQFAIARFA